MSSSKRLWEIEIGTTHRGISSEELQLKGEQRDVMVAGRGSMVKGNSCLR